MVTNAWNALQAESHTYSAKTCYFLLTFRNPLPLCRSHCPIYIPLSHPATLYNWKSIAINVLCNTGPTRKYIPLILLWRTNDKMIIPFYMSLFLRCFSCVRLSLTGDIYHSFWAIAQSWNGPCDGGVSCSTLWPTKTLCNSLRLTGSRPHKVCILKAVFRL